MVFLPSAGADMSGLGPFVGSWQKHEEGLVIDSAGTGIDTYPDVRRCPTCSNGGAPPGVLAFVLTAVSDGMATGSVTASSDPQNHAVGESVTATLADGLPGKLLKITIGGVAQLPFCDGIAEATGQCGA